MQKEKLRDFKSRVTFGISSLKERIPLAQRIQDLADTTLLNILHQSFLAQGLGKLRFEYSISGSAVALASPGFLKKQSDTKNNLVLHYELRRTGQANHFDKYVTVVVPSWRKTALREMGWILFASIALTVMMLLVLCSTSLLGAKDPSSPQDEKNNAIKTMMQQLEAPLSTVSLAADALRNDKVMHDPGKIRFYQQVISEENERMNREVEKLVRMNTNKSRKLPFDKLFRVKR